ncbi:MAG: efflux RND transporter periplasmic adaptor subunit [Gammaproteobacteria bacterium]
MKKRTIGVLVVGAAAVGAVTWNAMRAEPLRVVLASVERGDVRSTVSNTRAGTVDACNRARMAPILSGQIAALPVAEGDKVEAGQILLELWNADVRAQVRLAEKERLAADARADETCAAARVAQREAERAQRLHAQGMTSEENADLAAGDARAKVAACRAMRGMIEVSDAKIELAQAHLEQTIVRAPFPGIVAEINGEIGEVVTPSPVGVATLPAVDLIDSSCIFVTAPIDEVDAPDIRAGMKASINLDAFPGQTFPATVRRVAPYVLDLEKQARTVDIEAEFDEPSDNLLPGYSADVEVTLDVHPDVLRIPTQALLGNDRVLVLNAEGIVEEKTIQTGLRNWQVAEVTEGLAENDRIVLSIDRAGVVAGAAAVAEDD